MASTHIRRGLASLLRSHVYPIIEASNRLLLVTRKRVLAQERTAQSFHSRGGQRVLVLAAHPDDETIGCFATILRHLEAGDSVSILMVTDGSGSRAGGLSPREMAAVRHAEVEELQILLRGVAIQQLGLAENHWQEHDLARNLTQSFEEMPPDIIYAPSCVDFHPEHIKVGKALARVLTSLPSALPFVRVYEMQVPLGVELVNLFSPLGKHLTTKQQAINLYKSQRGALDLWRRQARYLGALYDAERGAEAFWEISAQGYCRIMDYAHWDWRTTPFKSLSGRPFGDVNAHLKGRRARLLLRSLAEHR